MINMPLFKCLLSAQRTQRVLSCVGAVAPSTTLRTPSKFDATAKMDPEMSGVAVPLAPPRDRRWTAPSDGGL